MASRAMSPTTVAREIAADRTPTPVEAAALALCRMRAEQGKPVTQLDITLAIGSQNTTGSTASGVLNRLEAKGYIKRTFYQRGVQVTILATGEATAPPTCTAAHWRQREQRVQTPPIAAIAQRNHSLAHIIEVEAHRAGKTLHTFLMDLVHNGMELYLEQKESRA